MKCLIKYILFSIFSLIILKVDAQFARSFYSTDSEIVRNSGLFEFNNKLNIVSVKESDSSSVQFMLIELDQKGETSNYRKITIPGYNGTMHMVSGCGSIGNDLLITVLFQLNSKFRLLNVKIDLSTNTVTNSTLLPDLYSKGFVRSLQKGDSLISYINNSIGGIYRLSRSIQQFNGNSSQLITGTASTILMSTLVKKQIELIIDGQEEYIVAGNKIYKRDPNGIVITGNLPLTSPVVSLCITKNFQNQIVVLSAPNYMLFNSSLNLIVSGTVSGLIGDEFNELYYANNNYLLYTSSNTSTSYKQVFDDNFVMTSSLFSSGRVNNHGIFVFENTPCVFGIKSENVPVNINPDGTPISSSTSSFIIKDNLIFAQQEFREYGKQVIFNNINYQTGHLNTMFNDIESYTGLEYNFNNSSRKLIYVAQNLLLGKNANGDTLGIGGNYTNKLVAGPYTPVLLNSFENVDNYNRSYYVDKSMLEAHYQAISTGNPTYIMPFAIEFWPGNGNPSLGQVAKLVDFFDVNLNGIYEPLLGDYPLIFGDKCVLNIYHQSDSSELANSIEVHQYFFMFDCDSSEAIKNTLFINQRFINRSANDMIDAFLGSYIDYDIGNYGDDYIGTNIELNMIYGYNADLFDENNGGNIGYQDSIPAAGMVILKGEKKQQDGIDNIAGIQIDNCPNGLGFGDGIEDNEYFGLSSSIGYSNSGFPFNEPNISPLFYYSLQGQYVDGTYDQTNGINVHHSFFGTSDPQYYSANGLPHGNDFSEILSNNIPGDRRILAGSGPGVFNSGDTIDYLTAHIIALDTLSNVYPFSVSKLFEYGTQIQLAFQNNNLGCGNNFNPYIASTEILSAKDNKLTIYPNPFSSSFRVKGLKSVEKILIFDLNGNQVYKDIIIDNEEIILDNLKNGVYILKVENGQNIYFQRIVKM